MNSEADARTKERQLRRLETFTDVVYSVVLVLIFYDLQIIKSSSDQTLESYLAAMAGEFKLAAFGIVVVLVYWLQNNVLLSRLFATDHIHSGLSILQVCVILLYILSLKLAVEFEGVPMMLVIMSLLVALMGALAVGGWWHASHLRRLLHPTVGDREVRDLSLGVLAEPITALITVPLAFVSTTAWELGWLSYLAVALVLKRWRPSLKKANV